MGSMPVAATSALRGRHRCLAELTAAAPGARVLDLGCGDGATLRELAGRVGAGGWLLGIDRNPRALAAAARGDYLFSINDDIVVAAK
jgi:ubiquinone/menaquinone biosynthesis C-methylase UbiE